MTPLRLPVIVDSATCSSCGGTCCKTAPGMAIPEDFGAPDDATLRERLAEALRSGRWVIEAGPRTPGLMENAIVRPAMVGETGPFSTASYGQCGWLGENGCSSFDERPSSCKALRVKERSMGGCTLPRDEEIRITDSWAPYREMLWELSDYGFNLTKWDDAAFYAVDEAT